MNKTRKQIIELISDYMDKTLSEGCLVFKTNGNIKLYLILDNIEEIKDYKETGCQRYNYNFRNLETNEIRFYCNFNKYIIGHYDITAVLKYINNKLGGYKNTLLNENFIEINRGIAYEKFLIPNKPLSLYSPEEEKDLLNLLLNQLQGQNTIVTE